MTKRSAYAAWLVCLQLSITVYAQSFILGDDHGQLKLIQTPLPLKVKQNCARSGKQVNRDLYYAYYTAEEGDYYAVYDPKDDDNEYASGYGSLLYVHGATCLESDMEESLSELPPDKDYASTSTTTVMPGMNDTLVSLSSDPGNKYYMIRTAHEEDILRGIIRDLIRRIVKDNGEDAAKNVLCTVKNMQLGPTINIRALEIRHGQPITPNTRVIIRINNLYLFMHPGATKEIDPNKWRQDSIRLTNASGERVHGTVTLSGDKQALIYTPASNLSARDLYTLKVSGFSDSRGKVITPYEGQLSLGVSYISDESYTESNSGNESPLIPLEIDRFCGVKPE
jgi:hypothetical protein